jgi:DivIVA domain-containing protein
MPLTPEDVRTKEFRNSFRGYNEEEVDAFLDEVEGELTRLLSENSELAGKAHAAPAPQAAPISAPMSETEEMLRRTLLIAQRTADETVAEAKAEADKLVADARMHAQQMVSQAQQQANTQLGDLESRRRTLEQHIEGLRSFEREYRTRLKAYLETQLRDLDNRAAQATPPATVQLPPEPAAPQATDALRHSAPPAPGAPMVLPPPPVDEGGSRFVRRESDRSDVPRVE